MAHRAYNKCYRNYYGKVKPFQDGIREYLAALKRLELNVGIATNRSREFLLHELRTVDDGSWPRMIDFITCADDLTLYKPDPQILRYALAQIDTYPRAETWYMGDSHLDMVTAKKCRCNGDFLQRWLLGRTGVTGIVCQRTEHAPDAIINSFDELMDLLQISQQMIRWRLPRLLKSPAALVSATGTTGPAHRTGLASFRCQTHATATDSVRLARHPGGYPGRHVPRGG
ncbi:MAG: HAD-IA family hydrolase [Gammaproteobacteria bacterium]